MHFGDSTDALVDAFEDARSRIKGADLAPDGTVRLSTSLTLHRGGDHYSTVEAHESPRWGLTTTIRVHDPEDYGDPRTSLAPVEEALEILISLKKEGRSFEEIASRLNAANILSDRGVQWGPTRVDYLWSNYRLRQAHSGQQIPE